jgi:hypothetical protein
MWFEKLTGFSENSPENVREKLIVKENSIKSIINGKEFTFGTLEIPTLDELKLNSPSIHSYNDRIQVSEIVADVKMLHCDSANKNALFQAASQFNLLEMVSPSITPEQGIDKYELDYTQGPACAIACGAGTIYRNYFLNIGNQIGQNSNNQIDCLELIGDELNNEELNLWTMKNGYALINQESLLYLNKYLSNLNETQLEMLKNKLKVGIQWNTEVTIDSKKQLVSQIYCSALPVAYSSIESFYWEIFARIILEATYEATFYAGIINYQKNGSNKIYLTLVGGGAFGNEEYWIIETIEKVINKFQKCPLDIRIVSYKNSNPNLKQIINNYGLLS